MDRRFWIILGGSILLHAILFAVTSWQRQHGPVSLPPILASIRLMNVSELRPVAVTTPASVPEKARPEANRTERPTPSVMQTAGPSTRPLQVPSPQSVPVTESVAATAIPSAPAPESPRPAAPLQRPQSEVLDGYRQRLGELLARHQEYPRVAAMRGWEGEVRLRLKVARKGNLIGVVLDHSSGFDVLDQHALAMLEALAGLPPLPEALEANEISVVVPVNYKLKKTT
ncbi:energy transducer TonB [Dechloromonas sp. HYN0024]|uniref:energy transducer TonB n=1 Tax=Dechloromonas sp. HYN0024 TaxID=2231055 RepID=UPI0013C3402E|nr:TonB family protein [Dechloromonas sp. HYN0024]